jgi:SAM-dependent methyltransferase/uncharacterized protein YbaR (Trm112 family)
VAGIFFNYFIFFCAMLESLVPLLRCPLSGDKLALQVIENFDHPLTRQSEILSGYLWSATGSCYPIVGGIPRMLPESILTYSKQLQQWWPEFQTHKTRISNAWGEAMKASSIRNKKIQSTFGFEWNLLRKNDQLKIWDLSADEFKGQLKKELQLPKGYQCSLALDAGCGHGRSAGQMTTFAKTVIGAEVSPAVELAYEQNDQPNCHFIQADVHYLPFAPAMFDLVYSSGVLHHNVSTFDALKRVAVLVKPTGLISIWLYHPFNNFLHTIMRGYRTIATKLPVQVTYYLNAFTLTPLQWSISQLAGRKKKWTEIAIEQLDILTPAYRHEHTHAEVKDWLSQLGFGNPVITDTDNYGFSIKAEKM